MPWLLNPYIIAPSTDMVIAQNSDRRYRTRLQNQDEPDMSYKRAAKIVKQNASLIGLPDENARVEAAGANVKGTQTCTHKRGEIKSRSRVICPKYAKCENRSRGDREQKPPMQFPISCNFPLRVFQKCSSIKSSPLQSPSQHPADVDTHHSPSTAAGSPSSPSPSQKRHHHVSYPPG